MERATLELVERLLKSNPNHSVQDNRGRAPLSFLEAGQSRTPTKAACGLSYDAFWKDAAERATNKTSGMTP